jgi:hypothetical protein
MNTYKFTLASKKVIYLREPKIGDLETAAQVAGKKAGDNQAHLGILVQKELLKTLLVGVDSKKLSLSEKENLDALFNFSEYQQAVKAVSMITKSEEEGNELTPEFVNAGE